MKTTRFEITAYSDKTLLLYDCMNDWGIRFTEPHASSRYDYQKYYFSLPFYYRNIALYL